nr:ATP-binding protein [Roseospira visakhapatnamensis]
MAVFLVVAVAASGYMAHRFMVDRDRLLHEHLVEVRATWGAVTRVYRLVAESIIAESVNTPEVWSIMRRAVQREGDQRDLARAQLRRLMLPVYERLTQRRLRQLHFHLPTAESFLRVHMPSRYGDSLTQVRPSVRLANTERRRVTAFEIGRLYHGFRFVFPLGDEHDTLGTVEASVGFDALSAEMAPLIPRTSFRLILNAATVRDRVDPDRLALYAPVTFAPDFLLEGNAETGAPTQGFGTPTDPVTRHLARWDDLPDRLRQGAAFALPVTVARQPCAVSFLPVPNVTGEVAAYVIAVTAVPDMVALRNGRLVEAAVMLLVMGLVVALLGVTVDSRRRALVERRRLLAVADTMAEGLYALDRRGRIAFVNQAAERLLGWTRPEILGRPPAALFVPPAEAAAVADAANPTAIAWRVADDDRSGPQARVTEGAADAAPTAVEGPRDVIFTRADGRRFTAQVTRAPLVETSATAEVAVITFSDVTERRRVMEDLRIRNALLGTQLDASPEGIHWVDMDGVVRSWNRRMLDLWGLGAATLDGADRTRLRALLRDRLADPDGPAGREVLALVERPPEHPEARGAELEVATVHGHVLEVLCRPLRAEDGTAFGHVWFTRDITPFRAAEQALADRSRAVQDANADLRASRENLRRRTTELARLAESLDVARGEAEVRKTEAERTLAQLRETQAHLVQVEKAAALGHLVSGVAHEINTPVGTALTAITHLTDELARLRQDVEDRKVDRRRFARFADVADGTAALVRSNLRRAADLVSGFQRMSVMPEAGDRAVFDLRAVVDGAVATVRATHAAHPARIDVDVPPDMDMEGYPTALGRVLEMLLDNALIHGLPDGRDGAAWVTVAYHSETEVVVRIGDDGAGIAHDSLTRVFEPFFSTRRGQGRNGLGLHIVFSTVTEVLGGRISLDSAIGRGTLVILELPRRAP